MSTANEIALYKKEYAGLNRQQLLEKRSHWGSADSHAPQAIAATELIEELGLAEQQQQFARINSQLNRLEKPHWVIWATFFAGAIAAIAAVILLFR
jgi:hypothetical protein